MEFAKLAKTIIKTELVKRDIDYPKLSEMLEKEKKIIISRENLSNKINRGTFSFTFALQIFEVLGVKNINLDFEINLGNANE